MRLFATDRVMKVLDTLGMKEGEMIENKMVTNAIEKAQKRVEENNYGIRKRLLEYDDVMNKQRNYIYARRQHALNGERIGIDIANMTYDLIENLVNEYDQPASYPELAEEVLRIFTIEMPFSEQEASTLSAQDKVQAIYDAAMQNLERRSERIREITFPVIKDIVENRNASGAIAVPITNGKRVITLRANIQDAYATESRSIVKDWHKAVLLLTIDELWKEHLRELDDLRHSVQNASYEQKDPLVIYKVESFHIFENMLNNLNRKAISSLMRGQIFMQQPAPQPAPQPANTQTVSTSSNVSITGQSQMPRMEMKQAAPEKRTDYSQYTASKESTSPEEQARRQAMANAGGAPRVAQPIKAAPRVGRNDPCPCGSGKKFKNCHGRGM